MIDQVVLSGLHCRWRTEVHAVLLACLLDVLISSRQANYGRVELGEVFLQDFRRVPRGVAGDHQRGHNISTLFLDLVVHESHLVQLVGADVGAVREAEVDLDVSAF